MIGDAVIAANEAQAEAFWKIRDSISEAERVEGQTLAHDISVPGRRHAALHRRRRGRGRARLSRRRSPAASAISATATSISTSAPASHAAPDWYDREGAAITRLVDDLVTAAGGSISAEHGIGQLKLAELERLAPPGRIHALRAIKHALDPLGIMNPGKLVP